MSSSPHPLFVLAALGCVATVIMLITACKVRRAGLKLLLVLISVVTLAPAGLVLVALHPEWTDERLRTYKDFYEGIQLGMTRAEIMDWQARQYPAEGVRKRPLIMIEDDRSLTFFMDPENAAEPNCEGIILAFKEGKLKSKTYSPD